MATKKKLTAYLNGEPVATRTTARTYTHVVIGTQGDEKFALAWCGRADLAQKQVDLFSKYRAEDKAYLAKTPVEETGGYTGWANRTFVITSDIR